MVQQPGLKSLGDDCLVIYQPKFLPGTAAAEVFKQLMNEVKWEQRDVVIMGKKYKQPRLVAYYAEDIERGSYTYSGLQMTPTPFSPLLLQLKQAVENFSNDEYDTVLLNYYRDGSDTVNWHSDNEKLYGHEPTIASLSFGSARDFIMRKNANNDEKLKYSLGAGDLLVMKGKVQQRWQHSVPRRAPAHLVGPRINLTFRRITNPQTPRTSRASVKTPAQNLTQPKLPVSPYQQQQLMHEAKLLMHQAMHRAHMHGAQRLMLQYLQPHQLRQPPQQVAPHLLMSPPQATLCQLPILQPPSAADVNQPYPASMALQQQQQVLPGSQQSDPSAAGSSLPSAQPGTMPAQLELSTALPADLWPDLKDAATSGQEQPRSKVQRQQRRGTPASFVTMPDSPRPAGQQQQSCLSNVPSDKQTNHAETWQLQQKQREQLLPSVDFINTQSQQLPQKVQRLIGCWTTMTRNTDQESEVPQQQQGSSHTLQASKQVSQQASDNASDPQQPALRTPAFVFEAPAEATAPQLQHLAPAASPIDSQPQQQAYSYAAAIQRAPLATPTSHAPAPAGPPKCTTTTGSHQLCSTLQQPPPHASVSRSPPASTNPSNTQLQQPSVNYAEALKRRAPLHTSVNRSAPDTTDHHLSQLVPAQLLDPQQGLEDTSNSHEHRAAQLTEEAAIAAALAALPTPGASTQSSADNGIRRWKDACCGERPEEGSKAVWQQQQAKHSAWQPAD